MSKRTDDVAFPSTDSVKYDWRGLTIREYAAIAAMQGLLAASGDSKGVVQFDTDMLVDTAVGTADALLAELEK